MSPTLRTARHVAESPVHRRSVSPSLKPYDRGKKFELYRTIPSLQNTFWLPRTMPRSDAFVHARGSARVAWNSHERLERSLDLERCAAIDLLISTKMWNFPPRRSLTGAVYRLSRLLPPRDSRDLEPCPPPPPRPAVGLPKHLPSFSPSATSRGGCRRRQQAFERLSRVV